MQEHWTFRQVCLGNLTLGQFESELRLKKKKETQQQHNARKGTDEEYHHWERINHNVGLGEGYVGSCPDTDIDPTDLWKKRLLYMLQRTTWSLMQISAHITFIPVVLVKEVFPQYTWEWVHSCCKIKS